MTEKTESASSCTYSVLLTCAQYSMSIEVCGSGTCFCTLRKQHRLGLFKDMVLRKVFRSRRKPIREEERKLHSWKIFYFYSPSNIFRPKKSRKMRLVEHVEYVRKRRKIREKPEGKRILGRLGSRLEDNIEKDLEEMWWPDVEWIHF